MNGCGASEVCSCGECIQAYEASRVFDRAPATHEHSPAAAADKSTDVQRAHAAHEANVSNKIPTLNLSDRRFGRLIAREYIRRSRGGNAWKCDCDCGASVVVVVSSLTRGSTRSCGCLHREQLGDRSRKHGESNSVEYESWCGMKKRCENTRALKYPEYGGRGIRVCERWKNSFETFLADMGLKPSPSHSLDRIDVNGDYEPSNCRWASPVEQANNRRPRRRGKKPCQPHL